VEALNDNQLGKKTMAKKKTTKKMVTRKKAVKKKTAKKSAKKITASTLDAKLEKTIEKDFRACELLQSGAGRNEWIEKHCKRMKSWQKAAEAGDARGQWLNGLCFFYGHGVKEDDKKAVKWFTKSAEQGNAQGQFSLGHPDEPVLTETILKNKLASFSEYASITPEAAALLVREGHGDELLSGYSGLTGLTSLSEGVAEYFSQHRGDLKLNLVTEISDSAAASLAKHEGILELKGLIHLSDTAVESLSNHQGDLVLDGLTTLSDAAAESLSKCTDRVELDGLTSLSDSAAESLSRKLAIQLTLPSSLADQVQTARKKLDKKSVLDRSQEAKIRKLLKTKETSNVLMVCELLETVGANEEEWISVFTEYRLKVLLNTWTPEIWDILATAMRDRLDAFGCLVEIAQGLLSKPSYRTPVGLGWFLGELVEVANEETIELLNLAIGKHNRHRPFYIPSKRLSDSAAQNISKIKTTFVLDDLLELADTPGHVALAEALAKDKYWDCVSLRGLTSLSDAAAESLSKYEGALNLRGLTSLSDEAAESLSKLEGALDLRCLTSLSDAVAESLGKHEGNLYLNGLTSLSDAAAESLAKRVDKFESWQLKPDNLSASAAQILHDAGHGE
jgi:hypothetical protein